MSVFGLYNSEAETSSGLHITQGYSKDKRPDLAQVTLHLISEHLCSIPLHFQMLNGNSSDSESFREVIRTFGKELHTERGLLTIVADSKLYSEQTIQELASAQLNWISRVPGTLQASSELIAKIKASDLKPIESQGYSSACYTYEYGGVHQHWVVYHSQSAFIKAPNVVASSFFVQKPERVAALAFVMTCCLLVYTALEYRIRKALEKENKTIPDQKNKPTQKLTTRWIFQLFVGIHLLILPDGKKFTLNLDTQHRDILSLLSYWDFYS